MQRTKIPVFEIRFKCEISIKTLLSVRVRVVTLIEVCVLKSTTALYHTNTIVSSLICGFELWGPSVSIQMSIVARLTCERLAREPRLTDNTKTKALSVSLPGDYAAFSGGIQTVKTRNCGDAICLAPLCLKFPQ